MLLIDPAIESLFDGGPDSNPEEEWNRDEQGSVSDPMTWSSYWYRAVVPQMQSISLSATVGFNRVALMLRLMSPIEEPKLKKVLSEEIITMKVSEDRIAGLFHGKTLSQIL